MKNILPGIEDSDVLSAEYARDITDKIRAGLEGVFQLIKAAYSGHAWSALGYASWDAYIQSEFGHLYLRPPREERGEVIGSLRDAGLSIRAIATATQLGRTTVQREIDSAGVPSGTPAKREESPAVSSSSGNRSTNTNCAESGSRVLGQDGKHYLGSRPRPVQEPPKSQDDDSESLNQEPQLAGEIAPSSEVDIDSVLDSPAADVGVKPLDTNGMRSEREVRTRKLIKAFNSRDTGSLPRTLQLAEQISGLVSPLSGEIPVARCEYESLTRGISAAVRQFSYVVKTLSGAETTFDNEQAHEVVVEDLQAALGFLRDSVRVMENK